MKKILKCVLLCPLIFAVFCLSSLGQSEDEMKAWQAYMTPGDMHKLLASTDGEWSTEATMWMDPNGQPVTSKGSCTNKMVLGGLYQESHFTGTMMDRPMEGKGIMAYDNLKKQFESTWIDNMGSGIMKATGNYDPSTKTISMSGNQTDPITGKECSFRETLKIIDDNNHVMTMYMTPAGGTEFKTMEIKFKKNE